MEGDLSPFGVGKEAGGYFPLMLQCVGGRCCLGLRRWQGVVIDRHTPTGM
jgi:hypothetical protein